MNVKQLLAATIIGDVVGSYYEGAQPVQLMTVPTELLPENQLLRILPLDLEKHRSSWTYTDDTICSLALLQAYLTASSEEDCLRKYCLRYAHPLIGFGGTFKKWLKNSNMGPYGSNANGCLMRVGFIPSLPLTLHDALNYAQKCTNITHNSPEAQQSVSDFIALCFILRESKNKEHLKMYLDQHQFSHTPPSLRDRKIFSMNSFETLYIAATCVLFSSNFEQVLLNCLNVGVVNC